MNTNHVPDTIQGTENRTTDKKNPSLKKLTF